MSHGRCVALSIAFLTTACGLSLAQDAATPVVGSSLANAPASQVIGATVQSSSHEDVGVVDDLMIEPSGQVTGLVIGLSGSLGAGEKDVAVPFEAADFARAGAVVSSATFRDGHFFGTGAVRVLLRISTRDLVSAPAFESKKNPGTGVPSPSSGEPESETKQPKSSTQSGGPG